MTRVKKEPDVAIDVWLARDPNRPDGALHIIADSRMPEDARDRCIAAAVRYDVRRYREARGPAVSRHVSNNVVRTPPHFLAAVVGRFGPIAFDLAASPGLGVAGDALRFGPEHDSLVQNWTMVAGNAWLNPPFDPLLPWVKKASDTAETSRRCGATDRAILMLLPVAIGTAWWRDCVAPCADIYSVGRMVFAGQVQPFPRDLALLRYAHDTGGKSIEYWDWPGRTKGKRRKKAP